MTAVQAIYDGSVFIPEKPCKISKGSKVALTVSVIGTDLFETQKKLADFRQLTKEVNDLNKTDPLPTEFDEILSQKVRIRELPG